MLHSKRRLLLSVLSVSVVASMIAGMTMAWFSDTESVQADFAAGVLNINLNEKEGTAVDPLDFTNVRPLSLAQLEQEFVNMVDSSAAFKPVQIQNTGTLPVKLTLSVVPTAAPTGCEIDNMVVDPVTGGVTNEGKILCEIATPVLSNELEVLLYTYDKATGAISPVLTDLDQHVDLMKQSYIPQAALGVGAGANEAYYVVAAHLPETTGNEYQGKHMHGQIVVNANQVEDDTTPPITPIIELATAEDMAKIGVDPAYPLNGRYILLNDVAPSASIGICDENLTPVEGSKPTENCRHFTGMFDGDEHTVTISLDSTANNIGLFAHLGQGSIVKNLTVDGSVAGNMNVGSISGVNYGRILNCVNNASVEADTYVAGGISGKNYGLISDSTNNGAVTSAFLTDAGSTSKNFSMAGGITGYNGWSAARIENSTNTAKVSATGTRVGGIAGITIDKSEIRNSSNTGAVDGDSYTGGIAGQSQDSDISACKNSGIVSSVTQISGGIVGYALRSSTASSSNEAEVKSLTVSGGIVGQNDSSSISDCINSGAVTVNDTFAGGIAAASQKSQAPVAVIKNCENRALVTALTAGGGIVGQNDSTAIQNCRNIGAVSALTASGGGIAGINMNKASIVSCTVSDGDVFAMKYAGGIAGQNRDQAIIDDCTVQATTDVDAGTQHAGGIVGFNMDAMIGQTTPVKNYAVVKAPQYAGGISGYNRATGDVLESCVTGLNYGNVTATASSAGGITGGNQQKAATAAPATIKNSVLDSSVVVTKNGTNVTATNPIFGVNNGKIIGCTPDTQNTPV